MRVSATARYVRGSTRKAHLVTQAIRGKRVEDAAALLQFMPQHAARDIALVLKSATANAENNHNLSAEDLVIVDARADERSVLLPWPRKLRVGENSPRRWPTMFSVMYTGMCFLPL